MMFNSTPSKPFGQARSSLKVDVDSNKPDQDNGDVCRDDEGIGHMPAGLIHDEHGVRVLAEVTRNFGQMLVHGIRVAPRHDECGSLAEIRANRTEDIGRPRALIMRR